LKKDWLLNGKDNRKWEIRGEMGVRLGKIKGRDTQGNFLKRRNRMKNLRGCTSMGKLAYKIRYPLKSWYSANGCPKAVNASQKAWMVRR